MASVNKVIIIGNLGRDPEVRYFQDGSAVCNLAIATSRNWKNKDSGERQEETEWHRVVLRERMAEVAAEYLKKGRSVYIEGRLKTRKWTDKDGVEKFMTEVIAERMEMLGSREGGGVGGEDHGNAGEPEAARADAPRRSAPSARPPAAAPAAPRPAPKSSTGFDDMDDDIPF